MSAFMSILRENDDENNHKKKHKHSQWSKMGMNYYSGK